MKRLVSFANCCFNSCAEQRHKGSVREATVEEQLCSKTIHLPALDLSLALDCTHTPSIAFPASSFRRKDVVNQDLKFGTHSHHRHKVEGDATIPRFSLGEIPRGFSLVEIPRFSLSENGFETEAHQTDTVQCFRD